MVIAPKTETGGETFEKAEFSVLAGFEIARRYGLARGAALIRLNQLDTYISQT